jgi:AcrR family transcriptional regulator
MVGHREALLEGAIRCIHEQGYSRTTARDLVAASGTNLASIGYHYGSKEALLRQAIFESFRRWYMPLIESVAGRGLEASARDLLGSLDEHRWLIVAHLEAVAEAPRDEELRAFIADRYGEFRAALAAQLGGGPAAEESAAQIMALLDGTIIQWLLGTGWQPDPDALLSAIRSAAGTRTPRRRQRAERTPASARSARARN